MMKGLMGRCLNHEMALDCIRAKARLTEDELAELKACKTIQKKKLALLEQFRGELEKQKEMLTHVFKDKEKEISDAKDQLQRLPDRDHVKEDTTQEYRDSDAYLIELGGIYTNGFDDCLCQVKASFPNLDLSHVSTDALAQTLVQPIHSESMDELSADDTLVDDPCGDGETAYVESQIKPVEDSTHKPNEVQVVEERDEDAPIQQQFFFFQAKM